NFPKEIGEIKGEGGYLIFPPSPYTLNGQALIYSVSQDIEPEPAPDWLYDLIIGSRPKSKSNGEWTGGYEWSEEWVKRKLDEVCERIRTAADGSWDEAARHVFYFGRLVGGGAYDVDAAWKILKDAVNKRSGPADWLDKVKRMFFDGVAQ